MQKEDWYLISLGIVVFALVSLNELGYGAIAFLPLMLLAGWLMQKVVTK